MALVAAGPAANPLALTARAEEDVLLFGLALEQTPLSSTFPAFAVKDGLLIPLGELCRLLDLAIQVDPVRGVADGFFLSEKRRFHLDVLAGTVTSDGRSLSVDRSAMERHADDIYVDSRLIAQWLPLDLKVNQRSALLTVIAREPLPMQLRWQRERELGRTRAMPGATAFPRVAAPYQLFEPLMIDEALRLTARNGGDGRRFDAQSSTFASGDLLYLSTSLYANADAHQGVSDFRATMGRRDPGGALLGPLQATEFSFGEVLAPGVNLISNSLAGTGALVTNFPLQRENAFDRHSFQGDLASGWQVELYRNQSLLAFQGARPDGRYEFLNVPLYYGWNDFRLVFYGPQGQRREEVVRFDVSENQTPAGAFQYRLVGGEPRHDARRGQFEGRYGLSKQLAASVAVADLRLDGVNHTYTEAGLQGFWKPMSASLTAVSDSAGGSIVELGARSRIGPVSLNLKQAQLQGGFRSELFLPVYGLVRNRSSLEASALLPSLERAWVTVDLGAAQDQLVAGGSVSRFSNRLSTSYQGYFLSNQLTRVEGTGAGAAFPLTTTGDFLASKYYRQFSLRAQANYQLSGGRRLNALTLAAETPMLQPYLLRASLTHAISNQETLLTLGANKTQGAYSLGLDLTYSNRTRLTADFNLRLGLGREPRQRRVYAQAQSMASYGAISAQAFLDANNNGVRDPGEKPLEGVGFLVNGAPQPRRSNAQGVAFLNNLSGDQDANLCIAPSTLDDPLMRPGRPGVRSTPRPGHVTQLDLPVVLFGEVTGTAFLKRDGQAQELPGLKLELVDAQGKAKTLRTAFDGFYDFTDLPPGDYQLRVPASEAARLGCLAPAPLPVHVGADGTQLDGLNLLLEAVPPAPAGP